MIFDNRLLWPTVSGRFHWLKSIAIAVVNCSRTEVVECSGLKPCWSGARMLYLLIVGKSRDIRTFAAGQRIKIGRQEVPCEVSLPGFGIGMINDDLHKAGI